MFGHEPLIRLQQTRKALIQNSRPLGNVASFLSIEGAVRNLAIPANGHVAKYLTELFGAGELPQDFQGRLEVTSGSFLAGMALRQRELIFTAMPVIP